jgi:hypothetical protein
MKCSISSRRSPGSLKVSIAFDVLDTPFRRRLGVVLAEIAENVALLIRTLNNATVQKWADDKD